VRSQGGLGSNPLVSFPSSLQVCGGNKSSNDISAKSLLFKAALKHG
jgi:hypothetical protein